MRGVFSRVGLLLILKDFGIVICKFSDRAFSGICYGLDLVVWSLKRKHLVYAWGGQQNKYNGSFELVIFEICCDVWGSLRTSFHDTLGTGLKCDDILQSLGGAAQGAHSSGP